MAIKLIIKCGKGGGLEHVAKVRAATLPKLPCFPAGHIVVSLRVYDAGVFLRAMPCIGTNVQTK